MAQASGKAAAVGDIAVGIEVQSVVAEYAINEHILEWPQAAIFDRIRV